MQKQKVHVVVVAKKNNSYEVLLLQTKKDRNEHWQNVTGSVDPGEDFPTAAQRELFEESGISAIVIETDLEFKFHDRWGKDVIEKVYYAYLEKRFDEIKLCDQEHQDWKWVDIETLKESDLGYPTNYQAIMKVLEELK